MARFLVEYTFQGRASEIIVADSLEAALAATEAKAYADDFLIDAEDIDDVNFNVREMHPVTRAGRELWTTYVREGDVRGHMSAVMSSPLFAASGGST